MSKLKRLLGALSLVALITFSSCVDDSVAPEVAALRQAQVDLLNQDVAFRAAQTALQQAEADYQVLVNSFKSANDAITLQMNQATLDDQLARLSVTLADQEAELVKKQLALEEAQAALAQYLATAGLQEASYYLEQWTIAYNGGTFSAPEADGVTTAGINALSREITMLENTLAKDKLLLTANDSVRQAYVDATLAIALAKTEALQASRTASLPTKEAALAALLANDGYAAIDALEDDLLNLAADSIAAKAALVAAQAAYDAAVEGGLSDADATIKEFTEEIDTLGNPNFDGIGGRTTWRQARIDELVYTDSLAGAASDTVEWLAYADDLQEIYDEFYEPYISEYETLLAAAEQDSIDAQEALDAVGGDQSLEDDVEDAYNLYIIEYNLMQSQAAVGATPGVGQVSAWNANDTANLVDLRTAFDGLNSAQMFRADGSWRLPEYGNMTNADSLWTWRDPSHYWEGARAASAGAPGSSAGPGNGPGVGGATAAYFTGNANNDEQGDLNEATTILQTTRAQIGALVEGFRQLEAKINAINAGTDKDGVFEFDLPDAVLDMANGTDFEPYVMMIDAIIEANEDFAAELTADDDYDSFCPTYLATFGRDADFITICEQPKDVELPDATNPSIFEAKALATRSVAGLDSATANKTYAASIVGQDAIDAYLAAVEVTMATSQAVKDAYGLSLVEPRLALDAAIAADAAVATAQGGIRSMIASITATQLGEYEVKGEDGSQVTVFVPFQEEIDKLEEDIEVLELTNRSDSRYAGSIQWTADEIERINVDILLAEQGVINVADMIADSEAELEVKRTELTVLQALADAFQELVLASLGG